MKISKAILAWKLGLSLATLNKLAASSNNEDGG